VLIALISIPMGWVTYQLNWIRQRRELEERYEQPHHEYPGYFWPPPEAPWPLGFFGDWGRTHLENFPASQMKRARELFPEALLYPRRDDSV